MSAAETSSGYAGGTSSSGSHVSLPSPEALSVESPRSVVGDDRGEGQRTRCCFGCEFVRKIKQQELKPKLVRSIIQCDDEESCDTVAYYLRDVASRQWHSGGPKFVAFCAHATGGPRPHCHIWHDCKLLQGNCRCSFLNVFKGDAPTGGRLLTSKTTGNRRHFRATLQKELKKEESRGYENILR